MSADVFISYAAKDRERVAKLVDGLQKAGVSVWIDMAGIEVASMWSKEIVSAIRDCKVLLITHLIFTKIKKAEIKDTLLILSIGLKLFGE